MVKQLGLDKIASMKLRRLTLSFSGKDALLEDDFLDEYYQSSLKQIRLALLMSVFLYGIFGLLDAALVPEKRNTLWLIRYAVVCPVLFCAFLFTYTGKFRKYAQPCYLLILVIGGIGIIGMIVIAPPPANFSYYAGLILIFMFGYTFIRARFIWATAAGWIIVALYEFAAVWISHTPFPVLVNNNFFFISANIIGMFACYSIEYYARRDFYMALLLTKEQEKVRQVNRELENRVRHRTLQLVEANTELQKEIEANRRSEEEKMRLQIQLQQAQKMEAIGTLAGGIAHDFNNILAAIMGYTEMTLIRLPVDGDPETKRNLDKILKASQRAKELVNQILTFSRQKQQEVKTIAIGPIIKEGLALLRASLPKDIEIIKEISTNLDAIRADPTQIHQILMNLCTNAAHAMERTGGTLTIRLKNTVISSNKGFHVSGVKSGKYLNLTVEDTGHGVDQKIVDRIFEPYFTTKKPGKGTGMGLAVIHGIVKSYKGTITVKSREGGGTAFEVFFPVAEKLVTVGEKQDETPLTGKAHILYVDDEDFLVELTSQMLEQLQYHVVSTESPRQALDIFKENPYRFDLLITDMTMPDMSGAQLAKAVMEIRKGFPVIICTGFSEQINAESAREMGFKGFLMKPFSIRDIAIAIQKALGGDDVKKNIS